MDLHHLWEVDLGHLSTHLLGFSRASLTQPDLWYHYWKNSWPSTHEPSQHPQKSPPFDGRIIHWSPPSTGTRSCLIGRGLGSNIEFGRILRQPVAQINIRKNLHYTLERILVAIFKSDLISTRFETMLRMCSWCSPVITSISAYITICISSKLPAHTMSRATARVRLPALTCLICLISELI